MLHNTQDIIRFQFPNNKAYTIIVKDGVLYLVSIISEANYHKMLNKLPKDYIVIHREEYNSFYYIGKLLPPIMVIEPNTIYDLLDTEWQHLHETATVFSLSCNPLNESSLT